MLRTEKRFAPQCGHNEFETVTSDRCSGFIKISAAEEQVSAFACSGSKLYVFYSVAEKRALAMNLYLKRIKIR